MAQHLRNDLMREVGKPWLDVGHSDAILVRVKYTYTIASKLIKATRTNSLKYGLQQWRCQRQSPLHCLVALFEKGVLKALV